jgi:hypothetical protein
MFIVQAKAISMRSQPYRVSPFNESSLHTPLLILAKAGAPVTVKQSFITFSAVSNLRDVIHQHLHPHPHVHRQVLGRRLSGKFNQGILKGEASLYH